MSSNITPKILVVEDEALLLFSIADDLRDAGFDVFEATNAAAAIVLLATNPEVKLLFDVDMPGSIDGLERQLSAWPCW
jgi:two-component system, response regulator PdtaR